MSKKTTRIVVFIMLFAMLATTILSGIAMWL
ncbi:stressosome-associated protein Prli42 [Heyndrickxia acidicola]|uniref:Stressosome-associated protein Prli42 n=1 Tax=Heyndrickxia acidicola TaxID=209389 RepID=A0ABU6MMN7_9BACI|nr:stressosome-associated protein Prli42 [Heyndrickxia acidicola]MED1205236.1 stressosome-associated protein Prli42 [Heyndrickxia acidicola]